MTLVKRLVSFAESAGFDLEQIQGLYPPDNARLESRKPLNVFGAYEDFHKRYDAYCQFAQVLKESAEEMLIN